MRMSGVRSSFRLASAAAALGAGLSVGAQAAPVQWTASSGGNDHFYDFVAGPFTWEQARQAAAASTAAGPGGTTLNGYLATVTSQEENDFLHGLSPTMAWIGASDEGSEGTWSWRTGPEAGQTFFMLGAGSQPGFSNWSAGEPNNNGDDNFVVMNWTSDGQWNDLFGSLASSEGGYFVEYDAPAPVPVPAALPLLGGALAALGFVGRRRKASES